MALIITFLVSCIKPGKLELVAQILQKKYKVAKTSQIITNKPGKLELVAQILYKKYKAVQTVQIITNNVTRTMQYEGGVITEINSG